jgi:subtilisin family serine protease
LGRSRVCPGVQPMSRLRVPLLARPPRGVAAVVVVGMTVSFLCGDISCSPSREIAISAFPKAMAWGWSHRSHDDGPNDGGWRNRYGGGSSGGRSGDARDGGSGSDRDTNRDTSGDSRSSTNGGGEDRRVRAPQSDDAQQSSRSSLGYDADRGMFKLGIQIGGDRHEHNDHRENDHHPEHNADNEHPGRHEHDRHDHNDRIWHWWRRHERHDLDEHRWDRHDHNDRNDWTHFHLRHHRRESADYTVKEPPIESVPISSGPVISPTPVSAPVISGLSGSAYPVDPQAPTVDKVVDPFTTRTQEGGATKPVSPWAANPTEVSVSFAAATFAPREVLAVGLNPEAIERVKTMGFSAEPPVGTDAVVRLTVPPGFDAERGQKLLNHEFPGRQFELNKYYRFFRASMSERAGSSVKSPPPGEKCTADRCFAREAIGWQETLGVCARGLKVGVIDTVIDSGHPAFAGRNNIHTFDFVPTGRRTAPDWHGTGVLSLLAANPRTAGAPGLIPDADFYVASAFFADDDGAMGADTVSVLQALEWMRRAGVKIVNMSFAGPQDALVAKEIARMAKAGAVFVAAAGNDGPTAAPAYPAAYPEVIAVTALTKDLKNYRYANRGPHIDVAAPGVDIWAAVPGGREGYHTGTSFASPLVAAVLAVEPREILNQEKSEMLDSLPVRQLGSQGRDTTYGRGLLLAPNSCGSSSEVASAELRWRASVANSSVHVKSLAGGEPFANVQARAAGALNEAKQ